MERYKKLYSSKWQNQYTEEFKRHVCNDFLTGELTRREVEKKYNLGNSRLSFWLKEFGYEVKKTSFVVFPTMANSLKEDINPHDDKPSKELKKQLEDALLLAESYKKMIEIAEQELKIDIRKKSNTK
ncbi:MAG TPA: hypothetical protein VIK89_13040 [Cytophagaceae bacterium]